MIKSTVNNHDTSSSCKKMCAEMRIKMHDNPRISLMKKNTGKLNTISTTLGWKLSELRSDTHHSYLVYKVEKENNQASAV